jgi:hypothetical protein
MAWMIDMHTDLQISNCWDWGICLFHVVWTICFVCNYSYVVHTEYICACIRHLFINWTVRMSDNLPERVQILGHAHIICINVWENRMICCQIFCDLPLKSAFDQISNVMQLIWAKIKWQIKWKYLIQKFHDICLSYYFKSRFWEKNVFSFKLLFPAYYCVQ